MSSIRVIKPNNHLRQRLGRLSDAPSQVFARGSYNPEQPAVAIVGSRKHSAYGREVATNLAGGLAKSGLAIISGLALGIDSVAHSAALDNRGATIAVMPGGVDRIYPASHRQLAEKIVSNNGALLSEYPPGSLPAKHHFVARNRIIAALSDAVLIIEAASRSGSLITAEFALDMGIPVLAVPGPITSPTSVGTNRLIDTGAKLISSVEDVLTELGLTTNSTSTNYIASTQLGQAVINCLTTGPLNIQEIATAVNIDIATLNKELTHLELESAIVSIGNNTWSLKPDLHTSN